MLEKKNAEEEERVGEDKWVDDLNERGKEKEQEVKAKEQEVGVLKSRVVEL